MTVVQRASNISAQKCRHRRPSNSAGHDPTRAFPSLNPVCSSWGRRTQGRQEPPLSSEFESSGHVVSDQVTPGGLACLGLWVLVTV